MAKPNGIVQVISYYTVLHLLLIMLYIIFENAHISLSKHEGIEIASFILRE